MFSFSRTPSSSNDSAGRSPDKSPVSGLLPFPRTLRRRKRISLKKIASSCSIRATIVESAKETKIASIEVTKSDINIGTVHSRIGSDAGSDNASVLLSLPLGHPGRPLYTAIRRNMFSAAPGLSVQHPRFPPVRAVSVHDAASETSSRLSSEWVSIPSFYPSTDGYGFSLSGETELRMAIARHEDASGVDSGVGEYKFQETKRVRAGKWGLKRIGRGLKDLFSLRARL